MENIYAALVLHKLGKEVNEEGIKKIIEVAGGKADEAKIKSLVASLKDVNIEEALKKVVAAPAASSGTAEEAKSKEEEKAEEKAEAAAEGLSALFG